jgi:hypothetical protein
MKVYRLDNDVNRYQYFLPDEESDVMSLLTDCTSRLETWTPPGVYVYKPRHKPGALYNFSSSSLIFSPHATEILRDFLEMAGELLPLPYEGKIYTLLNVTECINCLDQKRSEWHLTPSGELVNLRRYVFHPKRLSESLIFKIPETYGAEVLLLDREDGEGFLDMARAHGLEGFRLELLWTDAED